MKTRRLWIAFVGVVFLGASCSAGAAPAPPESARPRPQDTTAAERIYERVAPSIASIETGISGGSGILIDESTVLTAAHVVWPYRAVRVVFPNGAELLEAPVAGVDPFSDLAIVDVSAMDGSPSPAPIGDGESIPLGRPVYLVGYPGETEAFPQATITEGILSRVREWEEEEWTFLQSDTSVGGGQSGGALVDEDGTVVGITNFSFVDEFGLSGSLSDAMPRIEQMRRGEDVGVGQFGERLPPDGPGSDVQNLVFENIWQDFVFVFEAPLYSTVTFNASSEADLSLTLNTIDGIEIAGADDTDEGFEAINELISYPELYMLRVESLGGTGSAQLESSVDLVEWSDPDDGRVLERGRTIVGNADYPGDFDWYRIDIERGQTVEIGVDAIAFDPALMVDGPEGDGSLEAFDDDSGGGFFGTDPRIVFTAGETGTFYILVVDNGETGPGAYRLTVD